MAGKVVRRVPWLRRQLFASTDYSVVSKEEAARQEAGGWLRPLTARRQQRAYDALLRQLRAGVVREDFAVAAEAIRSTDLESPSILEVGCGGGAHAEVFERLLPAGFTYSGMDYSPAMVELARRSYPAHRFAVGDATRLPFPDDAFDVVFDGVALMHVLEWDRAIAEAARVAKAYCVYHSVPVFGEHETTLLRKYAYGAPVIESVFNRGELLGRFEAHGLALVRSWLSIPYDVHAVVGAHSRCETFLLRVGRHAAETAPDGSGNGAVSGRAH